MDTKNVHPQKAHYNGISTRGVGALPPIDLVYLWVDGNAPELKQKRLYWQNQYGEKINPQATDKCRFIDNQELKYSLRSVEKYAPWINNIFIVTDNQIPEWLNTNNEKIHIIDHKDIMPPEALPTFNSVAIETCICNIKNLSEYFLFANDDMFFADYTEPSFFFTEKGYPIFRVGTPITKKHLEDCNYFRMIKNSYDLIEKEFGYKLNYEPHHNIDPYRKSDIIKCNKLFKEEIEKTTFSKFRSDTDVQRVLYSAYACAIKEGKLKKLSRFDWELPLYKKLFKLITLNLKKDSAYFGAGDDRMFKKIKKYKPNLICINDYDEVSDTERAGIKPHLEKLFPEKSQFEL